MWFSILKHFWEVALPPVPVWPLGLWRLGGGDYWAQGGGGGGSSSGSAYYQPQVRSGGGKCRVWTRTAVLHLICHVEHVIPGLYDDISRGPS